ncbi:MAG: flagellar hook protein FlgE [Deltaproteobacteria bacterium]|jgi:flagellar hook protein FlgE|nr:flagellar hook protein FlgE [Deltaproteobacteria bacterium]
MSLFSTLSTAASGLGVASSNLSVIGDNIANMNTTGFKSTRSEFADYRPQDVFGLAGPSQVGKGAGINNLQTLFGQGSLMASQNPLDMAIAGDGFFVVSNGVNDNYTRAGQFYLDDDGFIVTADGARLQGYNVDSTGTLGKTVADLQLDTDPIQPAATAAITLTATLDADTAVTGGVAALVLDGTAAASTLEAAANASDFAASVTSYDSLGVAHEVTVLWEYAGANTWNWYAVVDAGELDSTALAGAGVAGNAFQIANGTATFDGAGQLNAFTETQTSATDPWAFNGANAGDIAFEMGLDAAGLAIDGRVRMIAGTSAVSAIAQDGYPPGDLASISTDPDGSIVGQYSNGQGYVLAQVVVARFPANAELERIGGTLFRATIGSGDPTIGNAGTGGRGTIAGNALEQSNVDLEREFVNLITSQRSYQANARMIDTTNSTLQELVQLV